MCNREENRMETEKVDAVEMPTRDELTDLTEDQRKLFGQGQKSYAICSACHGSKGEGVSGMGVALSGSEWANGNPEYLIRIVLQGFNGGADERGENMPDEMPGHSFLSDEELAGILTFVRQSWGNDASPIESDDIANVRSATSDRKELWSPEELRKLTE